MFIILLLASMQVFSQVKPVEKDIKLTRPELDSAKSILATTSQRISQLSCLTQGEAAQIQQLLGLLYATINRKEQEAIPPAAKPKE